MIYVSATFLHAPRKVPSSCSRGKISSSWLLSLAFHDEQALPLSLSFLAASTGGLRQPPRPTAEGEGSTALNVNNHAHGSLIIMQSALVKFCGKCFEPFLFLVSLAACTGSPQKQWIPLLYRGITNENLFHSLLFKSGRQCDAGSRNGTFYVEAHCRPFCDSSCD